MALDLFKRVESRKGLFAVEKITLIYNLLTSILILFMFQRMDHPLHMLWDRAVIAAVGQTFFAIVALHTFSIGNILMPIAVLYVLPAGICAVEIAVELWKGQTPVR